MTIVTHDGARWMSTNASGNRQSSEDANLGKDGWDGAAGSEGAAR
jgi:hypothetical protein